MSSAFEDALSNVGLDEARDAARRAEAKAGEAQRLLKGVRTQVTSLEQELERVLALPDPGPAPEWVAAPPSTRAHEDKLVLVLSDLHLDEVVQLEEMNGVNEYNRKIADRRLSKVVDAAVDLSQNYLAGAEHTGWVIPLLGDFITGAIHEELAYTNEAPPAATLVHWAPKIASALKYVAEATDLPVHCPCHVGNHDRFYKKNPYKLRSESSLGWIMYHWIMDACRDDDRITFSIPKAPESRVDVYDYRLLLHHGDGFTSQGGVGGIYPALLKYLLRAHELYSDQGDDFDLFIGGHWHHEHFGDDFIINGTIKGYDEYALGHKFKNRPPGQAMFTVTPEHGIGWRNMVWAD